MGAQTLVGQQYACDPGQSGPTCSVTRSGDRKNHCGFSVRDGAGQRSWRRSRRIDSYRFGRKKKGQTPAVLRGVDREMEKKPTETVGDDSSAAVALATHGAKKQAICRNKYRL